MKRIGFLSFDHWQPSAGSQTRAVCAEPGLTTARHESVESSSVEVRKVAR
jgi:hypothetical protein